MTDAIAGLEPWELAGWVAPSAEGLPDWLASLHKRHADAVTEYRAAVAGVIDTTAEVEGAARAWRRSVRDAVAQGRKPPTHEAGGEVDEARVAVAQEDADFSRRALAEVCVEVLNELRQRRDDFAPHFRAASAEIRFALGRGPSDGLTESERKRRERLTATVAEVAIPDISDPSNSDLTKLGDQEVTTNAA